jgi:hypothetical protein
MSDEHSEQVILDIDEKFEGPRVIGAPYRPREQCSSTRVLSCSTRLTVVPARLRIVDCKCALKAAEMGRELKVDPEIVGSTGDREVPLNRTPVYLRAPEAYTTLL